MTTKTRYFAIVSLLVLTVGLGYRTPGVLRRLFHERFSRDQQPDELKSSRQTPRWWLMPKFGRS